jgi:hypothetical protein
MCPVEDTVSSCFLNPNLGKSPQPLSACWVVGRAQLLSVVGGYLLLRKIRAGG